MSTARKLAIGATAATIGLALAPGVVALATGQGVEYDASVAILTATAVAIIWYTSFTFEATDATRRMAEIMSRDAFRNVGEDAEKLARDLRYLRSNLIHLAKRSPDSLQTSASRGQLDAAFKQDQLKEARTLARGLPDPHRSEVLAALQEVGYVTAARSELIQTAKRDGDTAGRARDYLRAADRAQSGLEKVVASLQEGIIGAVSPEDMGES